ncbi:MAG: type 4a pilus biogenesis protein PilO [Myxococcales bacterium]|jgi:type IV pilus assembly protein PilO
MAPKIQANSFGALPIGAKVFLLFVIMILMTSGYYVGFHMTLVEEIESAERKHGALERQLEEAHDRQKEYLKLREEVAAREALDQQNLRILPVNAEIPAFLDDLNRLAELSGLEMANVSPASERAEKFFVAVPVELRLQGRYHQLAKFFYNISRLERAINMEDISLSVGKKNDDDAVTLAVRVSATTFRRANDGQGGGGKQGN